MSQWTLRFYFWEFKYHGIWYSIALWTVIVWKGCLGLPFTYFYQVLILKEIRLLPPHTRHDFIWNLYFNACLTYPGYSIFIMKFRNTPIRWHNFPFVSNSRWKFCKSTLTVMLSAFTNVWWKSAFFIDTSSKHWIERCEKW